MCITLLSRQNSAVAFLRISFIVLSTRGYPGFVQVGEYSVQQRAATVLYRGAQFFSVGFISSVLGHSLTMSLVSRRIYAASCRLSENLTDVTNVFGTLEHGPF